MNINKIIIGGRLTDDPEIRMTTGDIPVCKFTVAVNRGGKEPKADFINCAAFRRTAEFVGKWFKKGRSIVVMGSMRSSSVERDGKKIVCWSLVVDEVDFGGDKKEEEEEKKTTPVESYFDDLGERLPF